MRRHRLCVLRPSHTTVFTKIPRILKPLSLDISGIALRFQSTCHTPAQRHPRTLCVAYACPTSVFTVIDNRHATLRLHFIPLVSLRRASVCGTPVGVICLLSACVRRGKTSVAPALRHTCSLGLCIYESAMLHLLKLPIRSVNRADVSGSGNHSDLKDHFSLVKTEPWRT